MISFIMPAKNAAPFIREAILSLKTEKQVEWELIVVDDHSTDETYNIVAEEGTSDPRVRVFKNAGAGKVQGLNYGFSLSCGEIIKCIDADDVLSPEFFSYHNQLAISDAQCHDAWVTDKQLNILGSYHINKSILRSTYYNVVNLMISVPRWTWSMKRSIAEKLFPMPADLPFEDVWFSFMIKLHAANIVHLDKKLYSYRQHESQTFGGILNYEKEKLNFRAKRALRLIEVLKANHHRLAIDKTEIFGYSVIYNNLLADGFSLRKIISSGLTTTHKAKLILICFFPSWASAITRLKWKWDNYRD